MKMLLRAAFISITLAGCVRPAFSAPPPDATPDVVLASYLDALVHGDCSAGSVLGLPSFRFDGDLCGRVPVSSYTLPGVPISRTDTDVVLAAKLVTTGSPDGIPAGSVTWYYELRRERGAWRLAGGSMQQE